MLKILKYAKSHKFCKICKNMQRTFCTPIVCFMKQIRIESDFECKLSTCIILLNTVNYAFRDFQTSTVVNLCDISLTRLSKIVFSVLVTTICRYKL